ncbi:MAG: hypothetical protein HRT68_16865 [Flavobacteriaceae bacterium]|nr:hypothetical protein [Flavobacteriaceae bacterium]
MNWEASNFRDTELFDMLAHKIRKSSEYYSSKDTESIFLDLFPKFIANEYYKIYIIHRTLGRPRDIVRMLTLIQEEYGSNLHRFEALTFINTEKKYSSYLKREISSELIGHVNDDDLDNYFNFLASVGKRGFTYSSALNKLSNNGFIKNESDLRIMISHLFRAGAICNVVRRGKEQGGDVFYWSYNDEDQPVNFDFNFEIHPGLWDVLRIPKPKHRLS